MDTPTPDPGGDRIRQLNPGPISFGPDVPVGPGGTLPARPVDLVDPADPLLGRTLDTRYTLKEQLGGGGMGVAYLADQTAPFIRQVAVKVIRPGFLSAEGVAAFLAEQQALATLTHPGVAQVYDAGTTPDGRLYLVMELVEGGESITAYCDTRSLGVRARLELFVKLCDAVLHIHQNQFIHLDLKPSNILVAVINGEPVPKVIDFGLAKARAVGRGDAAPDGKVTGTPLHMAPEQADPGNANIDTRADVYALGVVLYELLTGRRPHDEDGVKEVTFAEALRRAREDDPPRPSDKLSNSPDPAAVATKRAITLSRLERELRADLGRIVMKALERHRHRRYGTAEALAADVQNYLRHEPVQVVLDELKHPLSRAYYWLRKSLRRNPAAGLLAVAVVFGIAGTMVGLVRANQAERAKVEALKRENEAVQAEVVASERATKAAQSEATATNTALAASERATVAERERRLETVRTAALLAVRRGAAADGVRVIEQAAADGLRLTPDLRLLKARALAIRSDLAGAQAELDRVPSEEWPPALSGPALLLAGDLQSGRDDAKSARLLKAARRAGLAPADDAYAAGLLAATAEEALREFQTAIAVDPQHVDARVAAVFTLFSLGRVDELIRLGEGSRPLAPDHPAFGIWLAVAAACRGERTRAERLLADVRAGFGSDAQFDVAADLVAAVSDGTAVVRDVTRLIPTGDTKHAAYLTGSEQLAGRVNRLMGGPTTGSALSIDRIPPAARAGLRLMWQVGLQLTRQNLRDEIARAVPTLVPYMSVPEVDIADAVRRHPEGTLKYVYAAGLFTRTVSQEQPLQGITPGGRRRMSAIGEAAEAAAGAPGLFDLRAPALEVAYASYALAAARTADRPDGDPVARERAGRLIRRRMTTEPPLSSYAQLSTAAQLAAKVGEYEHAQLLLNDIERRYPKESQLPEIRAMVSYHHAAYSRALGWIEKAGDYGAGLRNTRRVDLLTPIRIDCLRHLGKIESAPDPRPAGGR